MILNESPLVRFENFWLKTSYEYGQMIDREKDQPLYARLHVLAIPIFCLVAECAKILVDIERVIGMAFESFKRRKFENGNVQTGTVHLSEHARNVAGIVAGVALGVFSPQLARHTFLTTKSEHLQMHLNAQMASQLYVITHALHTFFEKNQIDYRICSGSLLGLIRHKGEDGNGGIIPWDDDVDTMVHPDHVKKCNELFANGTFTQETGIEVKWQDFTGGWECFYADSPKGKGKLEGIGIPFVDVFCTMYDETGESIVYQEATQRQLSTGDYFTVEEWNASKEYSFGPIKVKGIQNPYPYLHRTYGDWKFAYQTMHHGILAEIAHHPLNVSENMNKAYQYGLPRRALIADNNPITYDKGLYDTLIEKLKTEK